MTLLLAAVLLAAAEPVPADPVAYAAMRTDLGTKFSAAWRRLLRGQPELADQYRFIQSRPRVDLRFPAPSDGFSEYTIATYDEGLIRVNRRWLAAGGAALEAKGVPYSHVPELMAWKALPILVHEVRHGITAEEMRLELGRVCDNFIVEEEAVAYRDEAAGLRSLLARGLPAFHDALYVAAADDVTADVLRDWNGGPEVFMAGVRARNPGKLSALTSTRAELLETAQGLLDRRRADLAAWRSKDPAARRALIETRGPDAGKRLEALVRHNQDCVAIFQDVELYGRWRRFFSERVEAFAEDFAEERSR